MNLILKQVKVQDKHSKFNQKVVDIAISNGKIVEINANISSKKDFTEEKFQNANISIGWFDMRVFSGDPGNEQKETFESLQKACINAGVTDIALLPNTNPIIQSKDLVQNIIFKSRGTPVNLHSVVPITTNFDGVNLTEMLDLEKNGAVAFSDVTPLGNLKTLQLGLEYARSFGGLIINQPLDNGLSKYKMVHEGEISTKLGLAGIPSEAEELMIERDLKIVEYTGGKIHFTLVNTEKGIQKIKEAKEKGLNVTCDTAIHYLHLSDESLFFFDANYKVMPPLRSKKDVKALRKALVEGVIDIVVSDHQPQNKEVKDLEFGRAEYGIAGLETLFPLLNEITSEFLNFLVYNPRKVLNLDCPTIEIGSDAKLTIYSTEEEQVVTEKWMRSKSKNTPFINKVIKGKVFATVNGVNYSKNA